MNPACRVPFSLESLPSFLPRSAEADPDVWFDPLASVLGVNSCPVGWLVCTLHLTTL